MRDSTYRLYMNPVWNGDFRHQTTVLVHPPIGGAPPLVEEQVTMSCHPAMPSALLEDMQPEMRQPRRLA
jgi:hypothetical protein